MEKDIVERLRERKATWMDAIVVMEKAANEIEHLRDELKRLKAAASHPKDDGPGG